MALRMEVTLVGNTDVAKEGSFGFGSYSQRGQVSNGVWVLWRGSWYRDGHTPPERVLRFCRSCWEKRWHRVIVLVASAIIAGILISGCSLRHHPDCLCKRCEIEYYKEWEKNNQDFINRR